VIKITQKIVGQSVVKDNMQEEPIKQVAQHAPIDRPELVDGKTYKIKTPLSEHALYITINNHDGRPIEMFINSKDMQNFQWVVALTRVVSAVFRNQGNCTFLAEELKSVFDPKGGYFRKGGKFMPSLVAEIGYVLEDHMIGLGLIVKDDSLASAAKAMIEEKSPNSKNQFGTLCAKCGESAVVVMDGCMTCTNCGDSKCG
jgi:hypothetical protein